MDWYVISENEHLGPFKEDVLEDLLKSGKVQEDTMLWCEGMNDPATYRDIFLEEMPPEIPMEALGPKPKTIKLKENPPEVPTPPSTPVEVRKEPVQKQVPSDVVDEEIEEKYEEEVEAEIENKPKKKFSFKKFFIFILLLAGLGAGGWFYLKSKEINFPRPSKMTVSDHRELLKTAKMKTNEPEFSWAISPDKTTIWMAMNSNGSGEITIRLASSPGMVLTEESIVAQSKGTFKNGIAQFQDFTFEQGQRIIDGRYLIEIKSDAIRPPLIQRLVGEKTISLSHQDIALLSAMNESVFEKTLRNFKEVRKDNAVNFWEDLEQKYRTVKAIGINIKESIQRSFENQNAPWNSRVNQFETEYKNNFGNFFTNFVIQNEKAYGEIKDKDFPNKVEIISDYTRLTKIAKKLGADTMNALEKMKGFKQSSNLGELESLKSEIFQPFDSMNQEIDKKLETLSDKKSI